ENESPYGPSGVIRGWPNGHLPERCFSIMDPFGCVRHELSQSLAAVKGRNPWPASALLLDLAKKQPVGSIGTDMIAGLTDDLGLILLAAIKRATVPR
ncbi:MAG: hypothetical protein ACYDHW_12745, partial [Syntrophorhabdaceae bacterium]